MNYDNLYKIFKKCSCEYLIFEGSEKTLVIKVGLTTDEGIRYSFVENRVEKNYDEILSSAGRNWTTSITKDVINFIINKGYKLNKKLSKFNDSPITRIKVNT